MTDFEAELKQLYSQVNVEMGTMTRTYVLLFTTTERWVLVARTSYSARYANEKLSTLWGRLGDLDDKGDGRCYYVPKILPSHVLSLDFIFSELEDAGITKEMVEVWQGQHAVNLYRQSTVEPED